MSSQSEGKSDEESDNIIGQKIMLNLRLRYEYNIGKSELLRAAHAAHPFEEMIPHSRRSSKNIANSGRSIAPEMFPIRLVVYYDRNFDACPIHVRVEPPAEPEGGSTITAAAEANITLEGDLFQSEFIPADARLCIQAYCSVKNQYDAVCWSDCGSTTFLLQDLYNNFKVFSSSAKQLLTQSQPHELNQNSAMNISDAVVQALRIHTTENHIIKGGVAIKVLGFSVQPFKATLEKNCVSSSSSSSPMITSTNKSIHGTNSALSYFLSKQNITSPNPSLKEPQFGRKSPNMNLSENLKPIYKTMETYLQQYVKESALFRPEIRGVEKINCPLDPSETTVANSQVCMPLAAYCLYSVPKIKMNYWYNAAAIMADRNKQTLTEFVRVFKRSSLNTKATWAMNLIVQYVHQLEYLPDTTFDTKIGKKLSIELFGDALASLSGDCEDLALAICQFYDDFLLNQHFGQCMFVHNGRRYKHICHSQQYQKEIVHSTSWTTDERFHYPHRLYPICRSIHENIRTKQEPLKRKYVTHHNNDCHHRHHRHYQHYHHDASECEKSSDTVIEVWSLGDSRTNIPKEEENYPVGADMLTEMQFILSQYIPLLSIEGVTTSHVQNPNDIKTKEVTGGHAAVKVLPKNYFSQCVANWDDRHPLVSYLDIDAEFSVMYQDETPHDLPVLIGEGTGMLDSGGTYDPHRKARSFIYKCDAMTVCKKPLYPPKGKSSFYKALLYGMTNQFFDSHQIGSFYYSRKSPSMHGVYPKGVRFEDLIAKHTDVMLIPMGFTDTTKPSSSLRLIHSPLVKQHSSLLTKNGEFTSRQLHIMINTVKTRIPPLPIHTPFSTKSSHSDYRAPPPHKLALLKRLQQSIRARASHHFRDLQKPVSISVYTIDDHISAKFCCTIDQYFEKNPNYVNDFYFYRESHSKDLAVWRLTFECSSNIE